MRNLDKTYDPKAFEDRIYAMWMEEKDFHAERDPNKKPYTIMMPPPNVTGNLHMGHALNNTLQDIFIRYKRMDGYSALWLPGTDHASISTEAKVVEKIKKDGTSKEELGREGFLKEAWDWSETYGGNIKNQLKKLGVSCDWDRERFTLDDTLSRAVEEVFMRLYEKDLIYRGDRIINWCPHCLTAISDAEVEHEDHDGHIWTFRYPVEEGGFIEIATTRPETIPGDLAVAVHPEDERYKDLVGKHVILPVMNRRIPIIADEYVEKEFGTGCVKITPSHDPNDFEVGARHDLGQLLVMTKDGHMSDAAGPYAGMERYACRKKIVEDLDNLGLLVEVKDHAHAVGHCERCKTVIEPMISKQWFVRMEPLAKPALEAYQKGELRFIPERFGKIYSHWLENIRDWCISRQLWWGHRLPVYYCDACGKEIVSLEELKTCPDCGAPLRRDEDTLDTWFSSALWPFSTLGWPEETEDMKYFYPTNVLITGYDIIFFWVIRMVFSALEQTGELPFKDVFLTGLVRDAQGRKMSKSLGNGIDPLEIIDAYGADALRYTLITGNSPGNDMRFTNEKVEAMRNFANKLWNASRFVLMHFEEAPRALTEEDALKSEDAWILSKLQGLIEEVGSKLDNYDVGLAAQALYDFIWSDFCDWYIEMVKPRLYGDDEASKDLARAVLATVLENILKLLHPFMPFITEEIWDTLPETEGRLIRAPWPKVNEAWKNPKMEEQIAYVQGAIRGIRNARAELGVQGGKKAPLFVGADEEHHRLIEEERGHFEHLGFAEEIHFQGLEEEAPEGAVAVVLEGATLYLPMNDLVDVKKERARLEKEKEKVLAEVSRVEKKLANEGFLAKAPEAVVEKEREKAASFHEILRGIEERLAALPQ